MDIQSRKNACINANEKKFFRFFYNISKTHKHTKFTKQEGEWAHYQIDEIFLKCPIRKIQNIQWQKQQHSFNIQPLFLFFHMTNNNKYFKVQIFSLILSHFYLSVPFSGCEEKWVGKGSGGKGLVIMKIC